MLAFFKRFASSEESCLSKVTSLTSHVSKETRLLRARPQKSDASKAPKPSAIEDGSVPAFHHFSVHGDGSHSAHVGRKGAATNAATPAAESKETVSEEDLQSGF